MLIAYSFYDTNKILDDLFKNKFIINVHSVHFFDNSYKFVYKFILFFAILNKYVFSCLNLLFKN